MSDNLPGIPIVRCDEYHPWTRVARRLAGRGWRVEDSGSGFARALRAQAKELGPLQPNNGYVFLAMVGLRSRLSVPADGNRRQAQQPGSCGAVLVDQVVPLDKAPPDLADDDYLTWRYETVAAYCVTYATHNALVQTNYRLYLGPCAIGNIHVATLDQALLFSTGTPDAIHPISRSAGTTAIGATLNSSSV